LCARGSAFGSRGVASASKRVLVRLGYGRAIHRQLHDAAFSISSATSRVRDHRDVARRDLDRVRAHPLRELPLGVGRDRLVV